MTENEQTSPDHTPTEPASESTTNDSTTTDSGPSAFLKLSTLFKSNTLDAAAWGIRIYIVILSLLYILLGGAIPSVDGNYKKAMIANALVACIRLHQRMGGNFSLNRQAIELVFREDSAHYLVYSIIFLMQPVKITMALLPISLMAMIHAVKYGYKVLDTTGWAAGRSILNYIAVKQQILFRLVALTEIFLMPALIVMVILGRAQLFSPFLYYRYLMLRYLSQRNAYCRQVFYELKMAGDQYKNSPTMPGFLKKAIDMAQKLCLRLVPAQGPAQ
jgi:hypothetical protein